VTEFTPKCFYDISSLQILIEGSKVSKNYKVIFECCKTAKESCHSRPDEAPGE
jgi:hypothetical protein